MSKFDVISDIGIGVIKNAGKTLYGCGKTVAGHLTEDPDMVQEGMETMGRGVVGMGKAIIVKTVLGGDDDNEDTDA